MIDNFRLKFFSESCLDATEIHDFNHGHMYLYATPTDFFIF